MNSFHNILDASKINKKNKKANTMKKYIETLENTQSKEKEKLLILKEKINQVEKKIEFNQQIKEEEIEIPLDSSFSKDIFFENNHLNIESLLTSLEIINDLGRSNDELFDENKVDTYEDKLSLRNMNLNIVSNKERFNLDIIDSNNDNLVIDDNSKPFNHENSLTIKTVSSTLEENELIKELNSEINKEIKKELDLDNMVDTSILTNVQIINMIYKESYKNKFVTGFGDFLRGSFFILEFCRKFKLKYNILIYHPIHQFFKHPTINREIPNSIIDDVEYCEFCNVNFDPNSTYNSDTSTLYQEFFNYLNRQDVFNRNLFIYSICFPTYQIHSENKQIIRKIIEPVSEIQNNINQILGQLKLSKKNYIIIQIRSGDEFLNKSNNTLSNEYKEKILPIIKNIIIGKKTPFLLIADNLMVKNFALRHFPFIKTYFKEITHLGENSKLNGENIKNTLIDFYIMSYASFIYSISSYDHGSGFSKWCSVTYDIPYQCTKI